MKMFGFGEKVEDSFFTGQGGDQDRTTMFKM
jgi:hypothetical protein